MLDTSLSWIKTRLIPAGTRGVDASVSKPLKRGGRGGDDINVDVLGASLSWTKTRLKPVGVLGFSSHVVHRPPVLGMIDM